MSVFFTRRGKAAQRVNYVEWLKSNGNQWCDTGVAVKSTIGYEVEFALESASGIHGIIGGFTYGGYNHNFAAYNGQWYSQYGNNGGSFFGTTDTERHILSQNVTSGVVMFDGETVLSGLTFYDNTDKTFALFCYNGGPSYQMFWPGAFKLIRCRMYDNGTLIRDLRPCYDPDGVACLYDKVEGDYHYNLGSGAFEAGGSTGGVSTITFTVSGTSYTAESGMTWAQFIASNYNTAGFFVSGNYVSTSGGKFVLNSDGSTIAKTTDAIAANGAYTTSA